MESISIFEIVKLGLGPSSSHTMGPWRAALFFLEFLDDSKGLENVSDIQVFLFGSLAKTGVGHGTDLAVSVGLKGKHYRELSTKTILDQWDALKDGTKLDIEMVNNKKVTIPFHPSTHVHFVYDEELPEHPNGLRFLATLKSNEVLQREYYSIGGGFVMTKDSVSVAKNPVTTPYPCHTGDAITTYCAELNLTFAELVRKNELSWRSNEEIDRDLQELIHEMRECVWRGLNTSGELPGGLLVRRRAPDIFQKLIKGNPVHSWSDMQSFLKSKSWSFREINNWVSCFAMAVNEENAAFGKVVTAPTNGAAGVIPAVLFYSIFFEDKTKQSDVMDFLLVAGEIGTLFKKGATISAAMGGCQAEIGVSSSMSAAGLTQILGGSPAQCLMAAEIAMEHHLGTTCDPIGGLVQIPCIERNSMGAIKAINAAHLALQSDPSKALVTFDEVVKSMLETAKGMSNRYKETSEGGLALSVGLPEC